MKKALCLSEHAFEPHQKQLDRCTIAVAFLGTPHRGSGLAPFATGVAQILKAGGKRVNRDILQLLNRDSEVLADVEESFGILHRISSAPWHPAWLVRWTVGSLGSKSKIPENQNPKL
jgi:hypothetical protein